MTYCLGLKLLKNINKISISPILSVKFYHRTGRSIKESKLITSDSDQMVYRGLFEKGIFGYDLEAQLLIENWGQFFQIELLPEDSLAALASIKQIVIVLLNPKPLKIMAFHRPSTISERIPHCITWNGILRPFKPPIGRANNRNPITRHKPKNF